MRNTRTSSQKDAHASLSPLQVFSITQIFVVGHQGAPKIGLECSAKLIQLMFDPYFFALFFLKAD